MFNFSGILEAEELLPAPLCLILSIILFYFENIFFISGAYLYDFDSCADLEIVVVCSQMALGNRIPEFSTKS